MFILNVFSIWLFVNLAVAAYVVWRHVVGPFCASNSSTLTLIDHRLDARDGCLWKTIVVEIWRDHDGQLQQSFLAHARKLGA